MTDQAPLTQSDVDGLHAMAMQGISLAAQLIESNYLYLIGFLEAESRSHSYLHITDPTLYGKVINSKNLALQVRLARAAIAFLKEVNAVKEASEDLP